MDCKNSPNPCVSFVLVLFVCTHEREGVSYSLHVILVDPKISISSISERLLSDDSLLPGVPIEATAIDTHKRFMQYRKYDVHPLNIVACVYNMQ